MPHPTFPVFGFVGNSVNAWCPKICFFTHKKKSASIENMVNVCFIPVLNLPVKEKLHYSNNLFEMLITPNKWVTFSDGVIGDHSCLSFYRNGRGVWEKWWGQLKDEGGGGVVTLYILSKYHSVIIRDWWVIYQVTNMTILFDPYFLGVFNEVSLACVWWGQKCDTWQQIAEEQICPF